MKTPEGYEKDDIDKFLKILGPDVCWSFKPYMAGMGKSGVPDYCLCICGAFWGIEVKRPGKEPTAIQERRMNEIRQTGGHAVAGTAEVVIAALKDWLEVRGINVGPYQNINKCPSCKRMFKDGETCSMGGCPMGGDV